MSTKETIPTPEPQAASKARKRGKPATAPKSKQDQLIALPGRRQGATIAEMSAATGWQPHSVRGAISGALKKKLGLAVVTETVAGRGRIYRLQTGV